MYTDARTQDLHWRITFVDIFASVKRFDVNIFIEACKL